MGERVYAFYSGRHLYCYTRKKYISHRPIIEDIKAGYRVKMLAQRACMPSVDATHRVLENILIEIYRKKIKAITEEEIIELIKNH